ncbi:GroES-like protein [Hypoxylon crocopeplum]|nr:GroES-like protein [Hypoxylon crocopeplum]
MATSLPTTMRSLVAPKYCWPVDYEVADMPLPTINGPKDILINIHAAGIATGDTQVTRGGIRFLLGGLEMPYKIGIEGAGVVVAVGTEVKSFKPGDEVYAFAVSRPMNMTVAAGFCSQYTIATEKLTLHKPANSTFEDVCNLASVVTAYQSIEIGLQKMRENGVTDGLEGKTVLVPGALSATGSVAIQLLKNVYGVGKLITTVSTAKIPLVEKYLPGLVDQIIDYTKVAKLTDAIPAASVDFVYNTQWGVTSMFPLLKPDTGVAASITSVPTPGLLRQMLPPLPFFVYWFAALSQLWYAFQTRGTRIQHFMHSGNPGAREDLEQAGEFLATGKVEPITKVVELEDIEALRREAQKVATGKGGIGKLVVKIA